MIDFRRDYEKGITLLISVLKNEPLPRPATHRGQLITTTGNIDRATLIAERAVPNGDPDVFTERLYCNLLPLEKLPKYAYLALPVTHKALGTKVIRHPPHYPSL